MEVCVKENIEMELFSSKESSVENQNQEDDPGHQWHRHLEHPLVQCTDPETRQIQSRRTRRTTCAASAQQQALPAVDDTIEMELLQKVKKKSACEHKASRLKWKKLSPQKSLFVVKDVLFLPKEQYLAQFESRVFSQKREVSSVCARMTVDHRWSAAQMDTRLRLVLAKEFGKAASRTINFTYLQRVQSSRSLFIPLTPTEGWSGANILRISALGPLYVLVQKDSFSQVKDEQPPSLHDRSCSDTNKKNSTFHVMHKRKSEELMCDRSAPLHDFRQRDAADLEIQSRLHQLQSCSNVRLLSPNLCEWMSCCGVPEISCASTEEMPNISRQMVEHDIHKRVSRMISQFTEGLNTCDGLVDVTAACSKPMSPRDFRELLTVTSDREEQEHETVAYWDMVLCLISVGETSLSFEDLLINGMDRQPPLGFAGPIKPCFYSQDAVLSRERLPFVSTCTLELFLHRELSDAADSMMFLTIFEQRRNQEPLHRDC